MLSKTDSAGFWLYGWDYENRMTSARNRNKIVRYQYDALGRRVLRHGKAVGANAKYTYDGLDVILDDGSDGVIKYQNGLGIDDKLKFTVNGQAKYFLQDRLGSTVGLADSSGTVVSSASYDSFGNSTNNLSTRYQYTGREYDSFTGLYFYRARWYDANLGRFISQDPIGFAGGDVNLFGYVRNNPIKFTDPMGFCPSTNEPCNGQSNPKLWDKPQFGDGPYTKQNPFTSIESGNVTSFWDDPLGTIGNGVGYYCYNFFGKGLFGDLGARGAGGGVPGGGEMLNTLELGPDLYNTLDTVDRRNQDLNDALRCAQGDCSPSPYKKGDGLGWW